MIRGFFSNKAITPKRKGSPPNTQPTSPKNPCEICGLYKTAQSPRMLPTGKGLLKCLIVGEAAGVDEDENWYKLGYDEPTQFIGKAGQLLREELDRNDLILDEDFWKTNSICCHPPKNRTPTKKELKLCNQRLWDTIDEKKPNFIWLLGGSAVESFYQGRFSNLSINRWRGLCIPDKKAQAWIVPMYHPSYVLRNQDENLRSVFRRDLKNATEWLKKTPPKFEDFESQIEIVTDFNRAKHLLTNTLDFAGEMAFDYETSGLKPYKTKDGYPIHKIWSVAIATDLGNCFALPIDREHWSDKELDDIDWLWKEILKNPRIAKIAHNLKFEEAWSRAIFGIDAQNWVWCTMNAAHLIDSRAYFTGLKFQAYINYGVEKYDGAVKKFIAPKANEDLNSLDKMPLNDLLLYNGMDALLTYRLYEDQINLLDKKPKLWKANAFWVKGLLALSDVQETGICMNKEYYLNQDEELGTDIEILQKEIMKTKEAVLFEEKIGQPINIHSSKDLKILLFDLLKLKPVKLTAKENPSVDKDALAEVNIPFTNKLTELRLLDKIKGTYLAQFLREIEDNKMHPFFDLHQARTYRSSSAGPNFQNIPVRNETAKKIIRSGILPNPGHKLCEVDYGSIEVRVAACSTQDPVLIKYINDPTSCMHRDQAKKIFKMTTEQVMTDIEGASTNLRFYAKNQFVFPEFYGSWYKACATNIWENCIEFVVKGTKVKDHLGMSYRQFENHVKKIEDEFWDRFTVFKKWQENTIKQYLKTGYVEMFFGHQRGGYLSKNKIINTPIQGTAFHLLLWSLIRLNEIRKEEKWKSRIIGQIHDSILLSVFPPEQEHILKTAQRVMCEDIRKENKWIIVPLTVDFEITEVDGSWYTKEKIKYGQ